MKTNAQFVYGKIFPLFRIIVMKATDMKNTTPELTNQEILRVLSLTPIIFMNSFSRTSFSRTMPLTVMATGKSQAKIMAKGNTHCMAAKYLEREREREGGTEEGGGKEREGEGGRDGGREREREGGRGRKGEGKEDKEGEGKSKEQGGKEKRRRERGRVREIGREGRRSKEKGKNREGRVVP